MSRSALVVIPTYNERANLPVLVAGLMRHRRTSACSSSTISCPTGRGRSRTCGDRVAGRVSVLHRTGKKGFGRSYIDGIQHALSEPVDVLCQMDADLSHDPRHLPDLIAATEMPMS